MQLDFRTGERKTWFGTSSEWAKSKMWPDRETSQWTTTSRREEAHRRNPVSQEDESTA